MMTDDTNTDRDAVKDHSSLLGNTALIQQDVCLAKHCKESVFQYIGDILVQNIQLACFAALLCMCPCKLCAK